MILVHASCHDDALCHDCKGRIGHGAQIRLVVVPTEDETDVATQLWVDRIICLKCAGQLPVGTGATDLYVHPTRK